MTHTINLTDSELEEITALLAMDAARDDVASLHESLQSVFLKLMDAVKACETPIVVTAAMKSWDNILREG